jgi:two-component system chemotaxis response regulator CheY
MRQVVREFLRFLGITEVVEAGDGYEALRELQNKSFALVLSDLNMAPMNGLTLLKELRTNLHFANLPFIMMTGERNEEIVLAAKDGGANDFIIKPFNAVTLRQKIHAVLGCSRDGDSVSGVGPAAGAGNDGRAQPGPRAAVL